MGQPHKHAELIKAWAEGAEIQVYMEDSETWADITNCGWHEDLMYRIKPGPQKSYVTQLSFSESMPNVDYSKLKSVSIGGIEFVPAAMLEKVAQAVRWEAESRTRFCMHDPKLREFVDIGPIIAKVKEGK